MTFLEKLRKAKKSVKSSSIDTYARNIRRLRKIKDELPVPPDSHKWLTKKELIEHVKKMPLNQRRHLTTAATVALSVYGEENKTWKELQRAAMKEFDEERRERTLSSKQKAKIPAKGFDALKSVIATMKRELRHILSKDKDEWSFDDLYRVQDLLILQMYYDRPVRLDYATLQIGTGEKGNTIAKSMTKPRGWHVTLRDFKTRDSMGEQRFKMNTANQRLLNKFMLARHRLVKHPRLLSNRNRGPMSRQVLSKRLSTLTRKRIGKGFSTQLLRILYAMKHRGIIESAKKVSEKLLHSQEQTLQYAKKD